MESPTERQQQVFDFFKARSHAGHPAPTIREICEEFGFRSPRSAADHVNALVRKGFLERGGRKSRNVQLKHPRTAGIPFLGTVVAGVPDDDCGAYFSTIDIDPSIFGIPRSSKAFAVTVRGDSMVGRHLVEGDLVILEQNAEPADGDVVAALICGRSTLKTFSKSEGGYWLRAENPKYPSIKIDSDCKIQGVVRGVLRTKLSRVFN